MGKDHGNDNGKPQGEQERNPTAGDLMGQEFQEIDEEEGGEPGASGDDGGGDQSAEGGSGEKKPEPPVRKWGGRFDSPEEMEAEFIRMSTTTRQPADEKPPEGKTDELPDLTEKEMLTLQEQDEADGSQFTREYLTKKMQVRNLTPHELKALRKVDAEQGTDLLGDYHEIRAERRVSKVTAPIMARSRQEQQAAFQQREKSIDDSNAKEFGDSLSDLEKFCSSPANVEKILQFSPMARIILTEHERGSPATAHKLLLREASVYQRSMQDGQRREKKNRSVSADAGGAGAPRKPKDSAATVEEAFEAAEEEQDR